MMIEQPVASAADALRTTWLIGKFHGVKAATGPTGSFITSWMHVLRTCRHDAAVGAAAFLSHPVDDVGGEVGLDPGLGERLALLHGHDSWQISSRRWRIRSAALRMIL